VAKASPPPIIRFPHTSFALLKSRLLADSPNEAFAVLFGKSIQVGSQKIIKVLDTVFAGPDDYLGQGSGHVRLKQSFVYDLLCDLSERLDADTIIDVHTHPFSHGRVGFSGIDDQDEIRFGRFLFDKFPDISYASIVLSQSEYSARLWNISKKRPTETAALIRTQTAFEQWRSSDFADPSGDEGERASESLFERAALVLGTDTIRKITATQRIAVVGVGGLGSCIAENLVHMGFNKIDLIDPDVLELSNVSRVVGATYAAAILNEAKVDVIKKHLVAINPDAEIGAHQCDIRDELVEQYIAIADWLIVATDNHTSRFHAQLLSQKYFVPLISAGVNISVIDGKVTDMSGEIIVARIGDGLCLNCLGRLNAAKIASESHPSSEIRSGLVTKGYVAGADVKEPAVKTLNSILSSLLVDTLVNQYTQRQHHVPILVYESNNSPAIFEDSVSLDRRNKNCFNCAL